MHPDLDRDRPEASRRALESINQFYAHCSRAGSHRCAANIDVPYPRHSELRADPRMLSLWVEEVQYDSNSGQLSGRICWPPTSHAEVYPVGLVLSWNPKATRDWLVDDHGRIFGGFTLRIARSYFSRRDQVEFDSRVGASEWVSIDAPIPVA